MSTFRKIISWLALAAIILPNSAQATTSYDVYDLPVLYTSIGISPSTTSGITLGAPYLNGVAVAIPAMSGAIFEFTQNAKNEKLYAARVAVDPTTKIITLSGVIRDLCYNQKITFTTCSNGQYFSKGATVILNDDARIFNLKANQDRANTFTASGSINFPLNGSGSFSVPVYSSTTLRDHNLLSTNGKFACSITDTACYFYIGGTWNAIGSSTVPNASITSAGKVQLGTIADQLAKTINGSSGAPTVVQTQYLTLSGSIHGTNNSYQAGRIAVLSSSGSTPTSLGGTGLVNPSSGSLLTGNGSGSLNIVSAATNSGKTIISNGTGWRAANQPVRVIDAKTVAGTVFNNADQTEKKFYQPAFSGSILSAGEQLKVHVSGTAIGSAGNPVWRIRVGNSSGTVLCQPLTTPTLDATSRAFNIDANLTVRTIGVSGTMAGDMRFNLDAASANQFACTSTSDITVDTTGSVRITVTAQWPNSSNTQTVQYQQASVIGYSKP